MLDFLGGPVVKNPRQCGARFGGSECSGGREDEVPPPFREDATCGGAAKHMRHSY